MKEPQTEEIVKLSAKRVREVFLDCLFGEGEPTEGHVLAKGIIHDVRFHPARLESHRAEIEELLGELPEEFRTGGWSFLNACMDKRGKQWGEHIDMEQLCQLGIGLGRARWIFPRDMWKLLPGGMPYFAVAKGGGE